MGKTAKATKKRIGRPEGRKPLLNLRIAQDLLDQLKVAAAEHPGRTVAEETVNRLRRSFTDEKMHAAALQAEVDARIRVEDELHRAHDQIEKLELRELNIAENIDRAISSAFEKAGLKPKDDQAMTGGVR